MKQNEILENIHRFRAEHSRECGYDVHKIFQQIRKDTAELKAEGWKVVSPALRKTVETSYVLREGPAQNNPVSQRKKMRQIYALFNGDRDQCVRAYADAERHGEVDRKSNAHKVSPEDYASRLFDDGIKKKWLGSFGN